MTTSPTVSLSLRGRLVAGGLGALAPVLLSLLVLDLRSTLQDADLISVAGYVCRIVALFLLGSLTAWLHKQEEDARKLFQLGIVAPSLLTVMINGAQVPSQPATAAPQSAPTAVSLFVTPLYAQTGVPVYSFDDAAPAPSASKRFLRGLVSASVAGTYFVAVNEGSYADAAQAWARANQLRRFDPAFQDAKVFRSPAPTRGYVVVLGGWLEEDAARALAARAKSRRLPAVIVTSMSASAALAQRPKS